MGRESVSVVIAGESGRERVKANYQMAVDDAGEGGQETWGK